MLWIIGSFYYIYTHSCERESERETHACTHALSLLFVMLYVLNRARVPTGINTPDFKIPAFTTSQYTNTRNFSTEKCEQLTDGSRAFTAYHRTQNYII